MWLFYERDQALQNSKHRDQSTFDSLADGRSHRYFISSVIESVWRSWFECLGIHFRRRPHAQQSKIKTADALLRKRAAVRRADFWRPIRTHAHGRRNGR